MYVSLYCAVMIIIFKSMTFCHFVSGIHDKRAVFFVFLVLAFFLQLGSALLEYLVVIVRNR
jgi:hypothetical protein